MKDKSLEKLERFFGELPDKPRPSISESFVSTDSSDGLIKKEKLISTNQDSKPVPQRPPKSMRRAVGNQKRLRAVGSVDVLYTTDTIASKKKVLNFFGEENLPITSGVGSRQKLNAFYGGVQQKPTPDLQPTKHLRVSKSLSTISTSGTFAGTHSELFQKTPSPKSPFHLTTFFDISVATIEAEGLGKLLISVYPLIYFLSFLQQTQCVENLLFILELDAYETMNLPNLPYFAKHLFQTYMKKDSLFELNLTYKSREIVKNLIKEPDIHCFASAGDETRILLDGTWNDFKASSTFVQMKEELEKRFSEERAAYIKRVIKQRTGGFI
ncbi:RGS domain-containing protein [Globomyces pollinis-pini]|nr:RGS domain-containing protein [Globomyces pollinis-pini]